MNIRSARPAVFGAVDGITSAVGIVLSLNHAPRLVFPAAVGIASAEAVGMSAGEYLSDSSNGWYQSAVIGASTGAAALAPAVPYLAASGTLAVVLSVAVMLLLAACVAVFREGGWKRSFAETYGILLAVALTVTACEIITPQG